jgi:hypothetical protein
MAFNALIDAPHWVMELAQDHLATYAEAVAAEQGINLTPIPEECYFDYDPGELTGGPWRFEVWGLDGGLDMQAEAVSSDFRMWIGVRGASGDLEALSREVRVYGVALVRMLHDEAARNDEFMAALRATLSPPGMVRGTQTFVLGVGVQVLVKTGEERA